MLPKQEYWTNFSPIGIGIMQQVLNSAEGSFCLGSGAYTPASALAHEVHELPAATVGKLFQACRLMAYCRSQCYRPLDDRFERILTPSLYRVALRDPRSFKKTS
jgi:hypothetical protein